MTENENNCCAEKGATNFKEFFSILLKSKVNGLIPLAGSVMYLILMFFFEVPIMMTNWVKFGLFVFIFAFIFMIAERFFAFKPKFIQLINMILIIVFSVFMIIGIIKFWSYKPPFDMVLYCIFLLIFVLSVNLYWCWDLIIPKMLAKKEAKPVEKKVEVELIDSEEKTPEAAPTTEPAPEVEAKPEVEEKPETETNEEEQA